jgi:crotonobetainyl-CoA:carnitine CoA-transferase CaiB-like acyl-CoA transferase
MTAPLDGIRVIEVGNFLAAPYATMQLADLGADVVKIERPGSGDLVRSTGPFLEGESSPFIRINRNKRSLALDLKSPAGREIFLRLAKDADIIVENLSPGSMAGLGLTYETLSADHPELIYVAASGWGQDGPYAQMSGLDIIVQGMSGIMSITGEPDGEPVKVGVPITDLTCALYAALAAVTALHVRNETGRGQFIDVCLLESGVSLAIWEAGEFFATGKVHGRLGTAHQASSPYQAIAASDGMFCIGAPSAPTFEALCKVIGRPELLDDPRFVDNPHRFANRPELIEELEKATSTMPRSHWVPVLSDAGVPCGPIQSYPEVFNDEHLNYRHFFKDAPHSTLGDTRQISSPMHFSETDSVMRRSGPRLGEHTKELLEELGMGAELEQLLADKVVALP